MNTADADYNNGQATQPVTAHPIVESTPPVRGRYTDEVEIIDLDDPRRDVKPTTWHQN